MDKAKFVRAMHNTQATTGDRTTWTCHDGVLHGGEGGVTYSEVRGGVTSNRFHALVHVRRLRHTSE